jgi:hypothetical protein
LLKSAIPWVSLFEAARTVSSVPVNLSVKSLLCSEKSSPSLSDGCPVTILYPQRLFVVFGVYIAG